MSAITEELEQHETFIVTKTNCPFCVQAKKLLTKKGVQFHEIDFLNAQKLVRNISEEESHMTFPMIYLKKKFIGGYDDLVEHYENEENKN
jgi:glutaredoxin 3